MGHPGLLVELFSSNRILASSCRPTILAYLESGPLAALIVFVGIILINGFVDKVLKPKFMGEGLDLAPIMNIFSITIWTKILGPLCAILGVPVNMILKDLVLEADEPNRLNPRLIGKADRKPPDIIQDEGASTPVT